MESKYDAQIVIGQVPDVQTTSGPRLAVRPHVQSKEIP